MRLKAKYRIVGGKKLKEASALLIVVLTALSMFSMLAPARAQGVSVFFYDDFEGVAVDPAKWNTDVATSGVRWNSSTADPTLAHTSPGSWEVPPVSPPYGSITVNNSIISFSDTDTPLRAFPYIWAGPPSRPSPFPEKGDFTFEVRMK